MNNYAPPAVSIFAILLNMRQLFCAILVCSLPLKFLSLQKLEQSDILWYFTY